MLVGLEKNLKSNMSEARDRSLTGRLSLQRDPGPEHVGNSDRGGILGKEGVGRLVGHGSRSWESRPDLTHQQLHNFYKRGAVRGRQTSSKQG